MDVARLVGAGRPGDLVGAAAVRAIAAVLVAHDPVLVARARVVGAARAVAAARVRAGGVRRRGREGEEGELHEWRVRGAASMPEKRGCPQIALFAQLPRSPQRVEMGTVCACGGGRGTLRDDAFRWLLFW